MRPILVRSPVARLRKNLKLSADTAAERAGISVGYLFKIEQGSTWASDQVIARLAELYDIPPEAMEQAMKRAMKTRTRYLMESLT